ncbi:MAG: T9SS type A sorting domain-containing protein [Moheibacter sp.]
MEKIFYTALLFCLSYSNVFSQQNELLGNLWYLTKIVEDGVEYPTPAPESNFADARLYFDEAEGSYHLTAALCAHEVLMNINTINDTEFSCEYVYDTMSECNPHLTHLQEFEDLYTNFWRDFQDEAKNPFLYEITEINGMLTLIVTNGEGNETYYGNAEMSIKEQNNSAVSIYPNPVNDQLTIGVNGLKNARIKILNSLGELVLLQDLSADETKLDFNFPKGIYYVVVESEGKVLKTEKLVK